MNEHAKVLKPLTWLKGSWKGRGEASFPTHPDFEYDDFFEFKYLEESFEMEPIIHFEEKAYVFESDNRVFKHWETGFLKPGIDGSIQLYVCQNTGRVEVCYGSFVSIDVPSKSFKIKFNSNFVRNEKETKTTLASYREIEFDGIKLCYKLDIRTIDVDAMTRHLTAQLTQIT